MIQACFSIAHFSFSSYPGRNAAMQASENDRKLRNQLHHVETTLSSSLKGVIAIVHHVSCGFRAKDKAVTGIFQSISMELHASKPSLRTNHDDPAIFKQTFPFHL